MNAFWVLLSGLPNSGSRSLLSHYIHGSADTKRISPVTKFSHKYQWFATDGDDEEGIAESSEFQHDYYAVFARTDDPLEKYAKDRVFLTKYTIHIVVVDLTNPLSDRQIDDNLFAIRQARSDMDTLIYLVGSKCDQVENRAVSMEHMQSVAKQQGIKYFEVSSVTGEGIQELFRSMIRDVTAMFPPKKYPYLRESSSKCSIM